jgi:hypothetical protein
MHHIDAQHHAGAPFNLLANAFLHETLDSGRPRIHDIATLYQQLDELGTGSKEPKNKKRRRQNAEQYAPY